MNWIPLAVLLAEGDFWTWMMKLTDKMFDPVFWTSATAAIGVLIKLYRDWNVPTDLRQNNKDTKETREALPGMVEKVESASKNSVAATEDAKKLVVTAAEKVGSIIGDQIKEKADINAVKVAEKVAEVAVANKETQEKLTSTVNRIANAIHGPGETDGEGGICLTAKVKQQGDSIAKLEKRLTTVETAVTDGFSKVLQELQTRVQLEDVRLKEARHAERDAAQAEMLKAELERIKGEVKDLKTQPKN